MQPSMPHFYLYRNKRKISRYPWVGGLEPPDDSQAASISWAASKHTFQIFMTMPSTASPYPVAWLNEPVKLDKSILSLAHYYFSTSGSLYV